MKRKIRKLLNPVVMFLTGLLIGALIRLFDLHTELLGEIFSRLAIWILLGSAIALYSSSALKAGINILLFSLGMLITYYLVAELTDGIYGIAYVKGWTLFALFTPLMAFLVRYSVMAERWSLLVRLSVIGTSICSSVFLYGGPRFYDIFINIALVCMMVKEAERKAALYKKPIINNVISE